MRNFLKYKIVNSPVGCLKIVVDDKHLLAILWDNETEGRVQLGQMSEAKEDPLVLKVEKQLREYFLGKRSAFDLPLKAQGTSFQESVWNCLLQIPYGVTLSYKDIALRIDNPKAVRAVGTAIGRNPISILIPCHRVIGSNGNLTGFAGGIERKQILLDLEKSASAL